MPSGAIGIDAQGIVAGNVIPAELIYARVGGSCEVLWCALQGSADTHISAPAAITSVYERGELTELRLLHRDAQSQWRLLQLVRAFERTFDAKCSGVAQISIGAGGTGL